MVIRPVKSSRREVSIEKGTKGKMRNSCMTSDNLRPVLISVIKLSTIMGFGVEMHFRGLMPLLKNVEIST